MPLYLVRWADLTASFVNAADEEELIDILDEIANPDAATWSEYDGPLHIEFAVPAKWHVAEDPAKGDATPLKPEQLVVDDVSEVESGTLVAEAQAGGGTSTAMIEEIYRVAFPHLHAVLYEEPLPEDGPDPDRITAATRQELMRQVQFSWRAQGLERQDDHISRIAAEMDASPRWVEATLRRNAAAATPPPPPKKPKKRRSRK